MLEDVIKSKETKDYTVSILLYSIDKENRVDEDNHNYEVRVSSKEREMDFYTDSEFYTKRSAIKVLNIVCKELREEEQAKEEDIELEKIIEREGINERLKIGL